jgi:hypothetical protein
MVFSHIPHPSLGASYASHFFLQKKTEGDGGGRTPYKSYRSLVFEVRSISLLFFESLQGKGPSFITHIYIYIWVIRKGVRFFLKKLTFGAIYIYIYMGCNPLLLPCFFVLKKCIFEKIASLCLSFIFFC